MAKDDFYGALGIKEPRHYKNVADFKTAAKAAYLAIAWEFGPDRKPGDRQAQAKFQTASNAYHVLSDDRLHAAYRRYLDCVFEYIHKIPGQDKDGSFEVFLLYEKRTAVEYGEKPPYAAVDFGFGAAAQMVADWSKGAWDVGEIIFGSAGFCFGGTVGRATAISMHRMARVASGISP